MILLPLYCLSHKRNRAARGYGPACLVAEALSPPLQPCTAKQKSPWFQLSTRATSAYRRRAERSLKTP